jgi:hypothetical protein
MTMTNQVFAEATTSTAFVLTLTKRQCNTLLRLRSHEAKYGKPKHHERERPRDGTLDKDAPAYIGVVQTDQLHALLHRGLVFWFTNHKGQPNGFGGLTKAGELAADLCIEAGMTIEGTNTISVLKRIDRFAA